MFLYAVVVASHWLIVVLVSKRKPIAPRPNACRLVKLSVRGRRAQRLYGKGPLDVIEQGDNLAQAVTVCVNLAINGIMSYV